MSVSPDQIRPGQTYFGRGRRRPARTVVAIGPEHRPLAHEMSPPCTDAVGVLFLMPNGAQGRSTLTRFSKWAQSVEDQERCA